jgi:hypothetical protein
MEKTQQFLGVFSLPSRHGPHDEEPADNEEHRDRGEEDGKSDQQLDHQLAPFFQIGTTGVTLYAMQARSSSADDTGTSASPVQYLRDVLADTPRYRPALA